MQHGNVGLAFGMGGRQAAVPYDADTSAGRRNRGFFDLRVDPAKISEIHEAANSPLLRALIEQINTSGSLFTIGCETGMDRSEIPEFTRRCNSYLQIAFTLPYLNFSRYSFRDLYGAFGEFCNPRQRDRSLAVEFEVAPTFYRERNAWAWSAFIWVFGYGASKPDARRVWEQGIVLLGDFLRQRRNIVNEKLEAAIPCFPEPGSLDERAECIVFELEAIAELFRSAAVPEIEFVKMAEAVGAQARDQKLLGHESVRRAFRRLLSTMENERPAAYLRARANVQRIDGDPSELSLQLAPYLGDTAVRTVASSHVAEYARQDIGYSKQEAAEKFVDVVGVIPKGVVASHPNPEVKIRLMVADKIKEHGLPEFGNRRQSRKERRRERLDRVRAMASTPFLQRDNLQYLESSTIVKVDWERAKQRLGLTKEQIDLVDARKDSPRFLGGHGQREVAQTLGWNPKILDSVTTSLQADRNKGAELRAEFEAYQRVHNNHPGTRPGATPLNSESNQDRLTLKSRVLLRDGVRITEETTDRPRREQRDGTSEH